MIHEEEVREHFESQPTMSHDDPVINDWRAMWQDVWEVLGRLDRGHGYR